MYEKGEVTVENYSEGYRKAERPTILLPHSCGEWVIGGIEEAEQMILDLQDAIVELKALESKEV